MMDDLLCARYESDGTIARFAANRLPDDAAEDFERHLVGCARCQHEVRVATAVRTGLVDAHGARVPARRRRLRNFAVIALAASVATIVIGRSGDNSSLRALGNVATPPAYGGIAVRRDAVPAESLFEAGMARYAAGDVSGATVVLADARARGADSVPTSFFLGVTHLLQGEEESALRELQVVLARPLNAYTAESHYYSAKAWLRRGRADSALAHLRAAAEIAGPFAVNARALADSVMEVER